MYNYIQGKIVDKTFTSIVVDNNGIGYEIGVSGNTLCDVEVGEITKVYTYLYVREDEMSLYGFSRLEEKKLEIMQEKLNIEKQKLGLNEDEVGDDGFLDALRDTAEEVWDD